MGAIDDKTLKTLKDLMPYWNAIDVAKEQTKPPQIHYDSFFKPFNPTTEFNFDIADLAHNVFKNVFKEDYKIMKRSPRYAIFFDNDGHPIDDCVMGIYEVSECFEPGLCGVLRMEGHRLDPGRIKNGGYIRRALFKPNAPTIRLPLIWKVIFSGPATIVIWANGDKTVVKAQKGETIDHEKGLALAITKYALGNKGNYYNTIRKLLKESSPIIGGEK